MGEYNEARETIEAGLRLHPSFRPLRAWRIFSLRSGGDHELALLDALELMLESLAPSRWDIFEGDIVAAVQSMRAELSADESLNPAPVAEDASAAEAREHEAGPARISASAAAPAPAQPIQIAESAKAPADVDVAVNVVKPAAERKKRARRSSRKRTKKQAPQLGKKAVRIDIVDNNAEGQAPAKPAIDDEPPAQAGSFKIPVDPD